MRRLSTMYLFCLAGSLIALPHLGAQEAARLIVSQSVTHNMFERTLPLSLAGANGRASAVDLLFCGTQNGAASKFIFLVFSGTPAKLKDPVLKREFCAQTAEAISSSISGTTNQPSAVAFGTAQWNNWELSLTTTTVAPTTTTVAPTTTTTAPSGHCTNPSDTITDGEGTDNTDNYQNYWWVNNDV